MEVGVVPFAGATGGGVTGPVLITDRSTTENVTPQITATATNAMIGRIPDRPSAAGLRGTGSRRCAPVRRTRPRGAISVLIGGFQHGPG